MKKLAFVVAAMLGITSSANAATYITDADDQLISIQGIEYRGSLYDVEFVDGRCTELFSGCDDLSDFTFQSGRDAGGMANLLKNDIILNRPEGAFDSNPALTLGCTFSVQCQMIIPFGFTSTGEFRYAAFLNGRTDTVIYEALSPTRDLAIEGTRTFARFSPATATGAVPEPSTWALLILGFFCVGAGLRRGKQSYLTIARS